MMSPKSLAFIGHLKTLSGINFHNGKQGFNKTIQGFGGRGGLNQSAIDPSNSMAFHLQSKDKRHQMHAPEVKQFILDDNYRRN